MWDDSYDSMPSPDIPKGKSGGGNNSKKGFQKDIDALFSPDNSAAPSENNSPDEKLANRKYQDPYAFNEPAKPENYLANFATNSGDLEDSILGELLGMPKKTPTVSTKTDPPPSSANNSNKIEKGGRKLSPAGKLEPIETGMVKSPRATNSPIVPNKSAKDPFVKQPIGRFSNDGPITSMKSFEFEQNKGVGSTENTNIVAGGGGRAHFNSFDVTDSNDDQDESHDDTQYLPSKPTGYLPTKVDSSVANKRTITVKNDSQTPMGIAATSSYDSLNLMNDDKNPPKFAANTSSKSNSNLAAPSLASASENETKSKEEEDTNVGFIPSFLDPSRQGRRRRGGDEGPRSSGGVRSSDARGGVNKLDELDAALGLATPAAGPLTGNKKPIDPFAAVEKKIPSLPSATGKKNTILGDSDSSSDDDLLKPKSRFSISTPKFGKPDATTPAANTQTNKPVSTFSSTTVDNKKTVNEATTAQPTANTSNNTTSNASNNPTSSTANATKTNLPSLGGVKLPSPDHKSAAFSVKFGKSRDDQDKDPKQQGISNNNRVDDPAEDSDELDVSGIIKLNDDELARFGLKDTSKDKNKKTEKDKEKEREAKSKADKEKETLASPTAQTGIQLTRKSVGNIRPSVSPVANKASTTSPFSAGSEMKSPTAGQSAKLNLSTSMDDETSRAPFIAMNAATNNNNNNSSNNSNTNNYSNNNSNNNFNTSNTSSSTVNSNFAKQREFTNSYSNAASSNNNNPEKKDAYSDFLSASSDSVGGNKANSVPPPLSPKKTSYTSSRVSGVSSSLPADQHDVKIDEILEQTKYQKEKNEKEMVSEIEALKNKIYQLETQSITRSASSVGGGGGSGDLENENRILMEQNQRLLTEQINYKRIISQLEIEVIRLKDELNLQSAKHLTDLRQMNEKHEGEVKEINFKHELEIDTIERRHEEAVKAVKDLHLQEIQSYKDRSKSTDQFDSLMKMIHQTTGSMKYLEEQLSTKHQSIQFIQKSHLDSREKQLVDLEEKAKERIEMVEVEEYKLKGILLHMETLTASLRSQNLEEKERLHAEHQRLQILQSSLINEKVNFQQQMTSEYALLQQKQKDFEYQQLETEKKKLQAYEDINHQQHQLDLFKKELETERQVWKKSTEQKERLLQDEEKRLLRQQEELMNEKMLFQQYKQSSEQELTVLEESKRLLKKAIDQLTIEKEEVYHLSSQLNVKSVALEGKEHELQQLQEMLTTKESILNNSFQEMRMAASELTLQEQQLHGYLKEVEARKKDLHHQDQSLLEKKLMYFQQFRDQMLTNVFEQQQLQTQLVPASHPPHPPSSSSMQMMTSSPLAALNKENQPNQMGRSTAAQFTMMPNTLGIYQTKSSDVDDVIQPPPPSQPSSSTSPHHHNHLMPPMTSSYAMSSPSNYQQTQSRPTQGGTDWTSQFKAQLQHAYAGTNHPERLLPKEIQSAQKLSKENRSFLQKHSNIEIRKFLNQEESFIHNLELLHRQKDRSSIK